MHSGWEAKSENQISLMTLGLNNKREAGIIYNPRALGASVRARFIKAFYGRLKLGSEIKRGKRSLRVRRKKKMFRSTRDVGREIRVCMHDMERRR